MAALLIKLQAVGVKLSGELSSLGIKSSRKGFIDMSQKINYTFLRRIAVLCSFIVSSIANAQNALPAEIQKQVDATQRVHNIRAWWGKEVVRAEVKMDFGPGNVIEGRFIFEAHGPRARYDRHDGSSIIFDGESAWVTPASAEALMGRFHVLTWPWFIIAPFKMHGEGINLSQAEIREINGAEFSTLFQTFDNGVGDSPEDWYRFFINQETQYLDAMSYIVTYGKDAATANKKPSIIFYSDYENFDGVLIATTYSFWFWDHKTGKTLGKAPKGQGTVRDVVFLKPAEADFRPPTDARPLDLPSATIEEKSYERLLKAYVKPTGVDYKAWSTNSADLQALNDYLKIASKEDLSKLTADEEKAFYINIYNAGMLQAVFQNYPIASVAEIGEPFSIFKKKFIQLGNRKLSLDDIEKGILLKKHFDPRIHFAVNCASESCPTLRAEPFTGERLEAQLDEQTGLFVNSARAVHIDQKGSRIQYSKLFKWYANDFGVKTPSDYLNLYRTKALPSHYKVDWIEYDWSLNEAQ